MIRAILVERRMGGAEAQVRLDRETTGQPDTTDSALQSIQRLGTNASSGGIRHRQRWLGPRGGHFGRADEKANDQKCPAKGPRVPAFRTSLRSESFF